jgi:hypothetical protein
MTGSRPEVGSSRKKRRGRVLTAAGVGGKHPSPAMIEVGCDMFLQQDDGPLLPILHAFMREDRYPRLAEIAVPTVVMVGSVDRTRCRATLGGSPRGCPAPDWSPCPTPGTC